MLEFFETFRDFQKKTFGDFFLKKFELIYNRLFALLCIFVFYYICYIVGGAQVRIISLPFLHCSCWAYDIKTFEFEIIQKKVNS